MRTNIRNNSYRKHEDDTSLTSIFPAPADLSLEELLLKALLKNIPIFLVTTCLIFLVA